MAYSGKIVGVVSIKGGVGKTTAVVNLAVSLARDYGKKVVVVDANFSSPSLGLQLGLVDYGTSLHAVLNDEVLVNDSIYEHELGFDVLPSSLTNERVNPLKLKQKIAILRKYYDFVVLDSSPSLNDELLATMLASDELFVVSSPDYPTLSTTLRAVKLAKEKGAPIMGIVLNKVKGRRYELSVEEIERMAKVPVLAVLYDDQKVLEALAAVRPVTVYNPYNKVALEYRRLAAVLADVPFREPGVLAKLWNYLREDFENLKRHDFRKGMSYYK